MTESSIVNGQAAFAALLALQEQDSAIDALEHRRATLPVRSELEDHERALAQVRGHERDALRTREAHEARLSLLATEVAGIVAHTGTHR